MARIRFLADPRRAKPLKASASRPLAQFHVKPQPFGLPITPLTSQFIA
jgi:hypothetical protein